MTTKADATYSERLATSLFRNLCRYDSWRNRHTGLAQVLNGLITSGFSVALYTTIVVLWRFGEAVVSGAGAVSFTIPPQLSVPTSGDYVKLACSIAVGILFNRVFLNGLLPTFPYARQSITMRLLGLDLISLEPFADVVKQYIDKHDAAQHVRVICITGKYLFREDTCPLYRTAREGKLHVLMPSPNEANATLRARYATFDQEYKLSKNVPDLEHFIDEVSAGARFLKEFGGNKIGYHDILCMWRIVLLSSHCIVQAYFPNRRKFTDQKAPVFAFAKRPEGRGAYYEIFDQMFFLVTEHGSTSKA